MCDVMTCHRFEAVWGWALSSELGLAAARRGQMAAVLLVPHDMTAAEVSTGKDKPQTLECLVQL